MEANQVYSEIPKCSLVKKGRLGGPQKEQQLNISLDEGNRIVTNQPTRQQQNQSTTMHESKTKEAYMATTEVRLSLHLEANHDWDDSKVKQASCALK